MYNVFILAETRLYVEPRKKYCSNDRKEATSNPDIISYIKNMELSLVTDYTIHPVGFMHSCIVLLGNGGKCDIYLYDAR